MFKQCGLTIIVFLFSSIVFSCESSNEENTAQIKVLETPTTETDILTTPNIDGSIVSLHGQLHVEGNRILDQNNNDVQLRGMSFFWSQ